MKMNESTSLSQIMNEKEFEVFRAAYNAWSKCGALRKTRLRNKNYTYGNQWCDIVKTRDGRTMPEWKMIEEAGKEPLSNNLIRQMVKNIVGRFRSNIAKDKSEGYSEEREYIDELDSRMLEEFLISGCSVQKVDMRRRLNSMKLVPENVSINKFFVNALTDIHGNDCEIIGEIHDMNISDLIMRLSGGDRERATWIRGLYSSDMKSRLLGIASSLGMSKDSGFDFVVSTTGKCRAIEVWTLETDEYIMCHDTQTATIFRESVDKQEEIEKINNKRKRNQEGEIKYSWEISQVWRCRWFAPSGELLAHYDSPFTHKSHPYVFKFYPLIDGEIHAFVEDVIDQQRYINRLITLVDHVMSASAKGVLMFPADSLPDDYNWDDIRKIWSSPYGVIPYEPSRGGAPHQMSSNATNIGAYELLSLEMKLFEEISGVSGTLQGKLSNQSTGAQLYQQQVENATIALFDIFQTFESFRKQRDRKLESYSEESK